jgi:pimeloyl-ACP methyl ester carboxylesterase
MSPRLLLVPPFTELQWTIKPQLEEWADVASYDPPGVGEEPLPPGLSLNAEMPHEERRDALQRWRGLAAQRGLELVDERGWTRFFVVMDGEGTATGVRIAEARPDSVQGLAIGHAALSRSAEGERPAISKEVHSAMGELLKTDSQAFIRYGIAQATAGSVSEELADRMIDRFPDSELAVGVWEMLSSEPEPVGDALAALGLPMLLAQHVGCLGSTEEGFRDIVARFPDAATVGCREACSLSPAFAEALREFCADVGSD